MYIKNYSDLAITEARKAALLLIEAGLEAIDTRQAILRNVRRESNTLIFQNNKYLLSNASRVLVIAVGKCALAAGEVLEEILGDLITAGIVLDVRGGKLKHLKTYCGTHPFPSEANVKATAEIIKLLSGLTEKDLVIFVVSGGGSTLLCEPAKKEFTFEKEAKVLDSLFGTGATIQEINTIRKHLSLARGGFLAKHAFPAKVVSLIFSDVPGNDLNFIASGPTVKDKTVIEDAKEIIEKYQIRSKIDLPDGALIETPKEDKYFEKVKNILIVSNQIALEAMAKKGAALGFQTKIVTNVLTGEAKETGLKILGDLKNVSSKTILLYGGETTVKVPEEHGRGGRNQTLALSALRRAQRGELVLSFASDGRDNTDFAGAICDMIIKDKAEKLGLDIDQYLEKSDSRTFFSKTDGYILTGDTGSNISDLIIAIKE